MRCLQCGKEIPEGRKFCNHHCSASYNNVRRQRKPWTEEQHRRVRKQRVCKYCGKPGKKVCDECRPFVGLAKVLTKLGWVVGTSLAKGRVDAEQLLQRLYFEDEESLLSISKRFGISKDTVKNYITSSGQQLRTLSEGARLSLEKGRAELVSSPRYKTGVHVSWEGNRYTFRSSWEERYMKELDEKRIPYLYEPFKIKYFDTQRGEERLAIPDFFLPETNTIVELKSRYTYDEQNMKDKVLSYKSRGYRVILLLDWVEMPL